MLIGAPIPIGAPSPLGDTENVMVTHGMTGTFSDTRYNGTAPVTEAIFTNCYLDMPRYSYAREGIELSEKITCSVNIYLSHQLYLAGSPPIGTEMDKIPVADLVITKDQKSALFDRLLLLSKYSGCTII